MNKLTINKVESCELKDEGLEQQNQLVTQGFSLAEYSQTHPYQYLKQLNNVYQTCNRTSGKDFSSASKVKLPWKKFKQINIPKCFQDNYNLQRKQTYVVKNSDLSQNSEEQEKQKKFWKQHQQLMKHYYKNNIEISNMKKRKMQQRRKNLFSAKSDSHPNSQNSFSYHLKESLAQNLKIQQKADQNKQNKNNERFSTTKTQSDQTQNSGFFSKNSILAKQRNFLVDKSLLKDKSNIFLKKIIQKGSDLAYDQIKLQEQVLDKLKKISMMPHFNRAKTANILSRQGVRNKQRQKIQTRQKYSAEVSLKQSRVKQEEYLQFNRQQELINRYKSKIKQIDCSISQKNVKKTTQILREMQQLAAISIQDY